MVETPAADASETFIEQVDLPRPSLAGRGRTRTLTLRLMPPTILIVEDEPTIADTLVYALKTEGFEPLWCATGREALAMLAARTIALVVLDVGLPDVNGFELCKTIRARSAVPVLFLTARADEIDRIVGLEIGGDDYVTKPFSPREVCARVKAILRRGGTAANPSTPAGETSDKQSRSAEKPPSPEKPGGEFVIHKMTNARGRPAGEMGSAGSTGSGAGGPARRGTEEFSLDEERCEIRFRGQRLDLTRYEYRLLKTLLARRGRVYSRDELMTQAWEDPGASLDRTVDAHIKTLRAKLRAASLASGAVMSGANGEEAAGYDPIQTHRGMGYSLRDDAAR
jgi:two-component system catabolic regulation response regulator CreB